MKTDLYSRMFATIEDLIPDLPSISAPGAEFYAQPRKSSDMSLLCTVTSCFEDKLELEVVRDEIANGVEHQAQWMKFRLDRSTRTACLIGYLAEPSQKSIQYETIYPQCRRLPLNCFAVNWLRILLNLQFVFRAVVPAASVY